MADKTPENKILPHLQDALRQINEMTSLKAKTSELIKHNLEKGLNNETILREILQAILPKRYGIGKGKIISFEGLMSRQCDIIIYDAMNCPCLFIDENQNQILPIEGVFAVIEVKTKLTKQELENAFEVIYSVKKMAPKEDVSENELLTIIPPIGYIISYDDQRSIETLYENYVALKTKYNLGYNSKSYSKKSPGYVNVHDNFLVDEILVINKGLVYYMLDGLPVVLESGSDSLGMFIIHLIPTLAEMKLTTAYLPNYYGDSALRLKRTIMTKQKGKFIRIFH